MKLRIVVCLQIALLVLMICFAAVALANSSSEINLSLSKSSALNGESVTASGTSTANAWVPLKIVDDKGSIVVFDARKAEANGNYSIDFIVPDSDSETLTVVVGEGDNVAVEALTVEEQSSDLPGDVNGSESVDIDDALLIAQYDAQLITLTEQQLAVADVNGSGSVNIDDALLIAQYDAQLISDFPVNQ